MPRLSTGVPPLDEVLGLTAREAPAVEEAAGEFPGALRDLQDVDELFAVGTRPGRAHPRQQLREALGHLLRGALAQVQGVRHGARARGDPAFRLRETCTEHVGDRSFSQGSQCAGRGAHRKGVDRRRPRGGGVRREGHRGSAAQGERGEVLKVHERALRDRARPREELGVRVGDHVADHPARRGRLPVAQLVALVGHDGVGPNALQERRALRPRKEAVRHHVNDRAPGDDRALGAPVTDARDLEMLAPEVVFALQLLPEVGRDQQDRGPATLQDHRREDPTGRLTVSDADRPYQTARIRKLGEGPRLRGLQGGQTRPSVQVTRAPVVLPAEQGVHARDDGDHLGVRGVVDVQGLAPGQGEDAREVVGRADRPRPVGHRRRRGGAEGVGRRKSGTGIRPQGSGPCIASGEEVVDDAHGPPRTGAANGGFHCVKSHSHAQRWSAGVRCSIDTSSHSHSLS